MTIFEKIRVARAAVKRHQMIDDDITGKKPIIPPRPVAESLERISKTLDQEYPDCDKNKFTLDNYHSDRLTISGGVYQKRDINDMAYNIIKMFNGKGMTYGQARLVLKKVEMFLDHEIIAANPKFNASLESRRDEYMDFTWGNP